MPSPSASLSTLRPELGSLLQFDLEMNRRGFIASRVLPVLEVATQAGVFGKIPLAELLQQRANITRAPGAGYARGEFNFSTDSYSCQERGAEEAVDDREARMYSQYFDAEQVAALRAFDAVLRGAEERVAALLFNTTTWTGSALATTTGTSWATIASAVPITDVEAAVLKVYDGTGLWPNALIMNRKVFRRLRNTTQIIDRIAASGAGNPTKATDITVEMLSAVFDLQVIVAGSSKNSAVEGATAAPAQIWDDGYVMVARIAETGDIREPCLGRTFHWGDDGSTIGGTFESYRDETRRSDIIRCRHDVHEKVLYTEAAHLIDIIP